MSLLVQIGEDDGGRSRGASVFPLIASTVQRVCPKGVPFYRRNKSVSFFRNFINCRFFVVWFFCFPSIFLYTDQIFYHDYLDLYGFQVKVMEYIQSGGLFLSLIYVINDLIMTSLLFFRIFNLLANFSILSDTLILYVFFVL